MAFKRKANAIVSKSDIHFEEWMDEIRKNNEGAVPKDYVGRVAKDVLRKCDPNKYLLSHATIVASVDVYAPQGVKTGKMTDNRGMEIEVKWPEYRIKPECQELINNNGDAWERSLLLSTYRTFIGAPNYLEHIQIPELSKGFIVDAIARDLGNTCYIDILVGTDRKHNVLIQDILSNKLNAMSMGCVSLFTICTHCGNVAIDDTQFCSHVAYDGKNSEFVDEAGQKHRLAELIGHTTVPNSNQFIEASWVRAPAFSGAQRRNVLNAEMPTIATKIEAAGKIYEIKCSQDELEGILRAASIDPKLNVLHTAQDEEDDAAGSALDELMGGGDEEAKPEDKDEEVKAEAEKDKAEAETEGGEETPAEPAKPKIDKLVEKAQEQLLQTIVNDLSERLAPKPEDVGVAIPGIEEASYNDNLVRASQFDKRLQSIFKDYPKIVKWASRVNRLIHLGGRDAIKRAGYTPSDLIVFSWINDTVRSKVYPPGLYKLAMKIGPINSFPSETSYFAACQIDLNRPLVPGEKRFLRQKGRIASLSTKF